MKAKYESGAFVFTRVRRLTPKTPEEAAVSAMKHGFNKNIIPQYSGDRATIGRAIQSNIPYAAKAGFLLRPVKRTSSEVVYAVVKESSDGVETLSHQQSDLIKWSSENAGIVEGTHPIALRVASAFAECRGKLVSDDWTETVTAELDRLGAVPFREDGRVYWLPPQSIEAARKLGEFLMHIGIVLVVAEVEAETRTVLKEIVTESVADQLRQLQAEVDDFDGKQKPSTYARRLDEYQRLRQKAILYRDSLGIGAEQAESMLNELEARVSTMLNLRSNSVVHKNKTLTVKAAPKKGISSLSFAGSEFVQSGVVDNVYKFTSDKAKAITAIKALESMGLAGKWQDAGAVKVKLQNSGPKGADVSIEIKAENIDELSSASLALKTMGISINQ